MSLSGYFFPYMTCYHFRARRKISLFILPDTTLWNGRKYHFQGIFLTLADTTLGHGGKCHFQVVFPYMTCYHLRERWKMSLLDYTFFVISILFCLADPQYAYEEG